MKENTQYIVSMLVDGGKEFYEGISTVTRETYTDYGDESVPAEVEVDEVGLCLNRRNAARFESEKDARDDADMLIRFVEQKESSVYSDKKDEQAFWELKPTDIQVEKL